MVLLRFGNTRKTTVRHLGTGLMSWIKLQPTVWTYTFVASEQAISARPNCFKMVFLKCGWISGRATACITDAREARLSFCLAEEANDARTPTLLPPSRDGGDTNKRDQN